MKITKTECDVCGKTITLSNHTPKKMQVIFTTYQEDGATAKEHYFDTNDLDLCHECFAHALLGNYIFARGAMGHNQYWFKKELNHAN